MAPGSDDSLASTLCVLASAASKHFSSPSTTTTTSSSSSPSSLQSFWKANSMEIFLAILRATRLGGSVLPQETSFPLVLRPLIYPGYEVSESYYSSPLLPSFIFLFFVFFLLFYLLLLLISFPLPFSFPSPFSPSYILLFLSAQGLRSQVDCICDR